ncbi:MAG TPA: SUMF1/EgtB/PvdO family nonheme iron enzyme [Polyangiaceae bacterium]|nr:SUMF1/EgtB/PvdO family nonheme iron enzyme [Polyangiaceae bacterium]
MNIPGGAFWVGNAHETYENEENPRFRTRVAAFCAAPTEVTVAEFEACVKAGHCRGVDSTNKTCNSSAKGRADHPINCIDYEQATAVCTELGGRLPTEVEWEYLARGGAEMREFPWGSGPADERLCWKNHQSCPVKSFAANAFGLYDVAGNVWEWTETPFSAHPWPAEGGSRRIVKGGGWSRRFEKWLSPTLRNREDPKKNGSHLGVRCVASLPGAECPYGQEAAGRCRFGIDEVECGGGLAWNGVRCAKPNETERCPAGTHEQPGHGCVRERIAGEAGASDLDLSAVSRSRSPEVDADCATNQPSRPHAYRYAGGEHLARNAVGKADGCKNRDVGVGWNSSCCP